MKVSIPLTLKYSRDDAIYDIYLGTKHIGGVLRKDFNFKPTHPQARKQTSTDHMEMVKAELEAYLNTQVEIIE